jgi:hypothetical protein
MFIRMINVENNSRFPSQCCPLMHGSAFPLRLLRDPQMRPDRSAGEARQCVASDALARAGGAGGIRRLASSLSPRHDRLCWLIQKCAGKRSCTRRSKAKETADIPLVIRTPMALQIDRGELTNRVTTSWVCAILDDEKGYWSPHKSLRHHASACPFLSSMVLQPPHGHPCLLQVIFHSGDSATHVHREWHRPRKFWRGLPADVLGCQDSREAAWAAPRRTARLPYSAQIFQITPVPGIWTSGPLPAPTKWVSAPLSRTAP